MKRKIFAALAITTLLSSYVFAYDTYDFSNGAYDYLGNFEDDANYDTPVITSPNAFDTIYSDDLIRITWKYTGTAQSILQVKDLAGNISEIEGEGNKAIIMPNKLEKGKSYILTVKAGDAISAPFTLNIATEREELIARVLSTKVERVPRIATNLIKPEGGFESEEVANEHMADVEVYVWDIGYDNQKYTRTISLRCNAALANTVKAIFDEIYNNDIHFPINSAYCYSYRTIAGSNKMSEHSLGTAIDINPNENYQLYDDGTSVGTLYEPYKNPYSLTPEIINIFRKYNFEWGASFGDYMHFSYFGG